MTAPLPLLSPVALVPAAGASSRMGRPKLLLPWGESTVLQATLAALVEGGATSGLVVTSPASPLRAWKPPPAVRLAVNPAPERGMLSTVLAGLDDIARAGEHADPLLVCPGDLPALRADTVRALLDVYRRRGGVVVPRHRGKRGHPLVLAPVWVARVPELVAADRGLRQVLELAGRGVHQVDVDDPGCVRDVDTPEEYESLRPR